MPPRKLISVEAAAAMLDVNPRSIRRYISTGMLSGYRVGGKLVKVNQAEVEAFAKPIPVTGPPAERASAGVPA
jgi:excisionase family DNA binding protein